MSSVMRVFTSIISWTGLQIQTSCERGQSQLHLLRRLTTFYDSVLETALLMQCPADGAYIQGQGQEQDCQTGAEV